MTIQEMKEYVELCLEGEKSIPVRKVILDDKRRELMQKLEAIEENIAFIDTKQKFYDDVLDGKIEYVSNLKK
ncbi:MULTISPECIES: hypothetical protein [unclassified Breznakia]|nr:MULTISPECIES: hypothetical protein [unclassified Breznakia]MDH6367327.1 DNA-binding transcriptional MerR regulator [Breznakia sp. PH1-1]MDH6404525.1 DNA-binding transcriptional MerR regulator [Breznakia sp. PF1-11]MDH6412234.1 DNA-binding transcriptional MerR regulator [Breznakia sp. PFB1-11]MDH6414494.1 DNA-binding transcriptional MerR regulator [Breznakia sp. PFB1-14]MDH6416898.1 DNA-binding transcriptional MerR regulator [Breznakia sp. PFB1-4]